MIQTAKIALCMAGRHAWNHPFIWTADRRRYARQVCTRAGCRHSITYPVVVVHRRKRDRRPLLVTVPAWPRMPLLAAAVLTGVAYDVFGGVIWH